MIIFDDSQWPLLKVSFVNSTTDKEFKDYLKKYTRILKRKEPYKVMTDLTEASDFPASHRKLQADWVKKHAKDLSEYCELVVVVIKSFAIRTGVKAHFKINTPPFSYKIVGKIKDAEKLIS